MPTKNPRIQVTLDSETNKHIASIAKEDGASASKVAAQLIKEALELREDAYLSEVSNRRIAEDNGVYYSFDEAFK